jgi:hypothetical protein
MTTKRRNRDRELAAYHEAGHVVARWLLEQRLPSSVTIVATDSYRGMVKAPPSRFVRAWNRSGGSFGSGRQEARTISLAETDIMIALAGMVAQKRYALAPTITMEPGGGGKLVARGSDYDEVIGTLACIWSLGLDPKAQETADKHYAYLLARTELLISYQIAGTSSSDSRMRCCSTTSSLGIRSTRQCFRNHFLRLPMP